MSGEQEGSPFRIELPHSTLAGLEWGVGGSRQVIAFHGWLDNADSFYWLGPLLAERGIHLRAFDLPGHGHSDHRPAGEWYHMVDNLAVMDELISSLGGSPQWVLGHSLGGVLSLLYASAVPESFKGLMVLDALGPMAGVPMQTAEGFRKALERQRRSRARSVAPVYPDLDDLVRERMKGFGGLSEAASRRLLMRNLEQVSGGWRWRSDPRLRWPSLLRMTEEQIANTLQSIPFEVHLVFARQGFFAKEDMRAMRLAYFGKPVVKEVEGPHHLHMDGDVEALAELVDQWVTTD